MNVEVFAAFYRRHYGLVLTVAQQRLAGWSDAEDITAEVFRVAWAHHREGRVLTLPWVYQVLRNLIGNEYRRLARADNFARTVAPLVEEQATELADSDAVLVRRCISKLTEASRELVYMAYWEGLSRAEIAEILGVSAVAVRLRLMRARHQLKELLANDMNAAPGKVASNDG